MNTSDKFKRARRWALAVLVVLAMGAFATRPNVASETQDEYWQRTGECIAWFFNDPDRHAAECVGDNERGRPKSLAPGENYTPPSPSTNPCPPGSQNGGAINAGNAGNAGSGGGGYDCLDSNGFLSSFVIDLFSADQLQTANI